MSSLPVCDINGKSVGSFDVPEVLLDTSKGSQAVRDAIVAYRANQRLGTASTKGKGEVAGNGQKPWRQKGTGNARAGYRQSPIWRGGGVVFGPKPRSFRKNINRKMMRLALARVIADRISEEAVTVVDDLSVSEPKTKAFVAALKQLKIEGKVLIVTEKASNELILASRNVPGIELTSAAQVNVYQLARYPKLLITKGALDVIKGRVSAESKETA